MPVKSFNPYTPSRRFIQVADFSELSNVPPEKSLVVGLRKKAGRNNTGQVMVRHRGGGARQAYRVIDFKRRDFWGVPAKVATIEYDPNRNARIAKLHYANGAKRYILHPAGIRLEDILHNGPDAPIRPGNALPLEYIPEGTYVHAIELQAGRGAAMARSAGSQAQVMAKEGLYVTLRLPSGETRIVPKKCMATVGQVGNIEANTITIGNAGRNRHLGWRPYVRGTAMNAVDHPLGGGRGKSKGHNHPRSPWNQKSKGLKTRSKKVWDWMILQDRRKTKTLAAQQLAGGVQGG
ncbi:MAG: 50S ribosomal protein L2 [Elusimicrobia bacterium]|nr:50S ribosomal protein L2 [Elusimicrobiota bacterium]